MKLVDRWVIKETSCRASFLAAKQVVLAIRTFCLHDSRVLKPVYVAARLICVLHLWPAITLQACTRPRASRADWQQYMHFKLPPRPAVSVRFRVAALMDQTCIVCVYEDLACVCYVVCLAILAIAAHLCHARTFALPPVLGVLLLL